MKMINILIWDKPYILKNTGGPAGYLYNIKEYLNLHPCKNISFYSDLLGPKSEPFKKKDGWSSNVKAKLAKACRYLPFLTELRRRYFISQNLSAEETVVISKFNYIHFHSITDFVSVKESLPREVQTILTTHTPEPLFDELCGLFNIKRDNIIAKLLRPFFLKKESKAYDTANKLMFPAEEALEVYSGKSKLLKETIKKNKYKMFFVPTALFPNNKIESNEYPLNRLSLPKDAFVICYIGRHNHVKGYDFIQKLALEVWRLIPHAYFIIGGKESPLQGVSDNRWKELGWINTQDVLNQSDIFILPNRETYFDLISLEVLRQGVPLVASRTGGNKWFEKNRFKGVFLFEKANIKSALNEILYLKKKKEAGELDGLKDDICIEYHKYFDMKNYINKYLNSIG